MDTNKRRENIIKMIRDNEGPVSASRLSEELNVSRQIIVGDVAVLRASGHNIVATTRGYIFPEAASYGVFVGKVVCQHDSEGTVKELYAIVDLGGEVVDVIVEHSFYGEITGQLNLRSRSDVDDFIEKVRADKVKLLSELTQGVHLHTISCKDSATFEKIKDCLAEMNVLYQDK